MDKWKITFQKGFNYENQINAIIGETWAKNNIGINNIINDVIIGINGRNDDNENNFKLKKYSSKKKKKKDFFLIFLSIKKLINRK